MVRAAVLAAQRILIVDDQESNVNLLQRILQEAGYHNVQSTTDSRRAMSLVEEFAPDILLLDLSMPHVDGYMVLTELAGRARCGAYMPVLVLTADVTAAAKRKALALGASDFLAKPFDLTEVLLRIQNLLETKRLHQELAEANQGLEQRVRERTADLESAKLEILERLALAGEYRDDATGEHAWRVGRTAANLASAVGLPDEQVQIILRAAPLHDIGKIGIPDAVLMKAGPLNADEMAVMKSHTTIGGQILSRSPFPIMQAAERIALTHHEKWDGSGYPLGLSGCAIPIEGRIVAIADVFDALTHSRPYKKAWSVEEALAEIERVSGSQFDPLLAQAFRRGISNSLLQLRVALQREGRSV